jgi:L-ascorbate metabolism protein UlaG (beta-lactamase superfamily)
VDKLSTLGFERGHALDTWESLEVRKGEATLKITAMPAKHATDDAVEALLMPVNGHLLDFSRNGDQLYRLYITGDTMLVDSLKDIPRRYPGIDLGLIHTGGTTFLVTVVTMTGEQAVRAVEITKPRTAIPIHYNDFSVFLSGLDDFKKAARSSTASTEFVYLAHGDTYSFKPNA